MTRTLTKDNISVTTHDDNNLFTIKDITDDQEIYLYADEVETIYQLTQKLRQKSSNPPEDQL